jgi:hypothetical protein
MIVLMGGTTLDGQGGADDVAGFRGAHVGDGTGNIARLPAIITATIS